LRDDRGAAEPPLFLLQLDEAAGTGFGGRAGTGGHQEDAYDGEREESFSHINP